ncbi:MAG: RNA polymerase sigma factor [Pirellulaceae bacterium]
MLDDNHLSQIDTLWSIVRRAHASDLALAAPAQQQLLERYGGAARRYLRAVVKDQETADDLYQQFAVKFLSGDLARATPARGRFRDLLKTTLFRMGMDHFRNRKRRPPPAPLDTAVVPAAMDGEQQADEQFMVSWREELLACAWQAMENEERTSGKPMYSALRLRVDQPSLRSPELAQRMSVELGREISSANVRVILHRARERFAALLLDAVVQSLDQPTSAEVEEELCELRLLEYCRPALTARDASDRQSG